MRHEFVILVFLVPYLLIYLLWCLIKFNMNTKLYLKKKSPAFFEIVAV